jgi:hypothetical protein
MKNVRSRIDSHQGPLLASKYPVTALAAAREAGINTNGGVLTGAEAAAGADPLCSIVFEAEPSEADAMRRPPRNAREPLFGRSQTALAAVQGMVLLAGVLGLYMWLNETGAGEGAARAVSFIALLTGHLALAAAILAGSRCGRSRARRWTFWVVRSWR